MKKFSCIIIDDEELGRDLLENFVRRVPYLRLKGKFSNPIDALSSLNEDSVDLIFLDIQMPEMTGIEFLKKLLFKPYVILTTAYDKYAIQGYELSVIDYLLKPFGFNRFLQAVNKVSDLIELKENAKNESSDIENNINNQNFLLINADHRLHRIYLKDIIYIQSMKEYVMYYLENGKIMALGSLKSLEEQLPDTNFIRIHKSYIIAKQRVKSLHGNQLEIQNTTLPIGGKYKKTVVESLFF